MKLICLIKKKKLSEYATEYQYFYYYYINSYYNSYNCKNNFTLTVHNFFIKIPLFH